MEREYYLEIANIYGKLMQMFFIMPFKYGFSKDKEKNINRDILNLYKKYLQLLINYQESIPCLENDNKLKNISCYLYALGLSIPSIFKSVYENLTPWQFGADSGEISGYESFQNGWTEAEFLDRIFADLDTLKIKAYPSTVNAEVKYNGYKIACFLDKGDKDYHFARQNINGLWSQKIGFTDRLYLSDNPMSFLDKNAYDYELIKTIEIVKPYERKR